jgi:hypothetical protein
MIRSRTTFIVGAGAGSEVQMPTGAELTQRIAQSFDFERFSGDIQTRDNTILQQYLARLAAPLNATGEEMRAAADRIFKAATLTGSIDAILEQQGADPLVAAAGKIAVAHFICQAESKSILRPEPKAPGELPMGGTENWLYEMARLITSGVPRGQAERCLDNVSVVSFCYDRGLEHFLPYTFTMAFGMALEEAQAIVAARLRVLRPYGSVGRLPWQAGDAPDCAWGVEMPPNINRLAGQVRTLAELRHDGQTLAAIGQAMTGAERLAVLGFGFDPGNVELLFSSPLEPGAEMLVTLHEMAPAARTAAETLLKRKTGLAGDRLIAVTSRSFEAIRDYTLLLES